MIFKETETVELKEKLNDTVTKEIVAFLNSFDGTIYLGIKDDGSVCGISRVDDTLKSLSEIITAQILPNPQTLISLNTINIEEKTIIEIKVSKGNFLYYIKKYGRSSTGCYQRIGTTAMGMTEEQIDSSYINSLKIRDESIVELRSSRQNLTFRMFEYYLSSAGIHFNKDTFTENFSLLTNSGEYNELANLLSDENNISIKVAVFKGKDKTNFIKRNEFGNKCIIEAMQNVETYIESLNETFIQIDGDIAHKERKKFNIDAFREAWINACVHNKWSEGVPPAVWFYDDRIEIFSNGTLPENLSKEDFYRGISKPVNKELTDIYTKLHLIEQSGHGVPIVVKKYGRKAFEFGKSFIIVTIPFEQPFTVTNETVNETANETVNETVKLTAIQSRLLILINKNPEISIKEMCVQMNVSRATITRNISILKQEGLIKRVGSDKTGKWIAYD